MELASCQPSGVYNSEVSPRFLRIYAPMYVHLIASTSLCNSQHC